MILQSSLVPIRNRVLPAVSSSGGRFACTKYGKYGSAPILAFLDLVRKYLVSASGTTQSHPGFLDGDSL